MFAADPAERHNFVQVHGVDTVHVCWCGKWPLHHVHTGNPVLCTCELCRKVTITIPGRST